MVLTTLREAGATNAELESAGKAVDGIAAAMCSSGLSKDKKQKVSLEAQQKALGKIFVEVNERLTAGTALAGENVTLAAFEDLMREIEVAYRSFAFRIMDNHRQAETWRFAELYISRNDRLESHLLEMRPDFFYYLVAQAGPRII